MSKDYLNSLHPPHFITSPITHSDDDPSTNLISSTHSSKSPVIIYHHASLNPVSYKSIPIGLEVIVFNNLSLLLTTSSKAFGLPSIEKGIKSKLDSSRSVEQPTRRKFHNISRKLVLDTSTDTHTTPVNSSKRSGRLAPTPSNINIAQVRIHVVTSVTRYRTT